MNAAVEVYYGDTAIAVQYRRAVVGGFGIIIALYGELDGEIGGQAPWAIVERLRGACSVGLLGVSLELSCVA